MLCVTQKGATTRVVQIPIPAPVLAQVLAYFKYLYLYLRHHPILLRHQHLTHNMHKHLQHIFEPVDRLYFQQINNWARIECVQQHTETAEEERRGAEGGGRKYNMFFPLDSGMCLDRKNKQKTFW